MGGSSGPHILLVEDDEAVREAIVDQLEDAGYSVAAVATGAQALMLLREGRPIDLIVFDLRLPVMDGWEFRIQQKGDLKLRRIPVIAMSGDASSKAAAVDADAFLQKPFKEAALSGEIDRLLRQEQRRAEQVAQMERLASLGMVAAGIGHEINNPLAYVLLNLQHALDDLERGRLSPSEVATTRKILGDAREGAERIRNIVRDLGTFARIGKERREAVDLHGALDLAVKMSRNELRHRGTLVKQIGPAPLVDGDESRLGQVFVNLLVNAAHSLDEIKKDHNEVRLVVSTDADGRAVVEVSDTGKGIAEADLPRIFEPFFTTKGNVGGTGLGLAMAYETIRKYGGDIQVQSTPGVGTTFRVVLQPWISTNGVDVAALPEPKSGARGRVLIVDDEGPLAKALAWDIGREHDAKIALSAEEALVILSDDIEFDVILCDMMMPGMSGMDLFHQLAAVQPALAERVIFMTGGAFSAAAREFLDEVKAPRLEKPFDVTPVRAIISERVAARRAS